MAKEKSFKDYQPAFRVGRRKRRAVLDGRGFEVVVFRKGQEEMAAEFVEMLNKKYGNSVCRGCHHNDN